MGELIRKGGLISFFLLKGVGGLLERAAYLRDGAK